MPEMHVLELSVNGKAQFGVFWN